MSIKVKASLKVLAYLGAGFKLVDHAGENPQVITKPMLMSEAEEGIASDVIIDATLQLSKEQIAELVIQGHNSRKLVVLVELSE